MNKFITNQVPICILLFGSKKLLFLYLQSDINQVRTPSD